MSERARILFEQGGEHDSAGREERAIPLYEQAHAAGLDDELVPQALLQPGTSLRNVGRLDEADALRADACRRSPNNAALPTFRALVLASRGRDRDALVLALDTARTRIDAPEVGRYSRALEAYTREL